MSEDMHNHDMEDFDSCPNCGGEGMCFEEGACIDPEGLCDLCERRCDWCAVRSPSVPVDEVDNGDK